MKRYHEAVHFRDENGNVTGAYVYDTIKKEGFPLDMDDFKGYVSRSEVMFLEYRNGKLIHELTNEERKLMKKLSLRSHSMQEYWDNDCWTEQRFFDLFSERLMPAVIHPIVKIPVVGEMLQISILANPCKLAKVKERFGKLGEGFRIVRLIGQDTLVITVPVKLFDTLKGTFRGNLQDCVFCFPPVGNTVVNTENIQKYSLTNRLLHAEIDTSLPQNILQFFMEINEERLKLRGQVPNRDTEQQVQCTDVRQTAKMSLF